MKFQVDQIDHVELTVPDRYEAAAWYREMLGFRIVPEFESWAEDPMGPLMIESARGGTKLALFTGQPTGSKVSVGFHLVAFRVDSNLFVDFLGQLPELKLRDHNNQLLTHDMVRDHGRAFSIYFNDPYGHQLEITTYDYESTKTALNQ